jgi:FkbM family methyltransferase
MSLRSRIQKFLSQFRPSPPEPEAFLRQANGIIHVGANIGQEASLYAEYQLPVFWVEPIPHIFEELQTNIAPYPDQRAVRALLLEHPNPAVTLNISSNHGASSSVLELAEHRRIWPEVHYVEALQMEATTLDLLLEQHPEIHSYDTLILDTQGTELTILRGGCQTLTRTQFVKTEVADFESYAGGCHLREMDEFLAGLGFTRISSVPFASLSGVGTYFDVLYARIPLRR